MAVDTLPLRRFADPKATNTITLPGACSCPNAVHGQDTATFRTQLGGGERQSITIAGMQLGTGAYWDYEAAESELIVVALTEWTFQDPQGEPIPITFDVVHRQLDAATRKSLVVAINDAHGAQLAAEQALLPKASAVRSPGSSRGNTSRTRTSRTRK